MKYLFPVFILFSILCSGQNLDLVQLETKISSNNRAGKHKESQNTLLKIIAEDKISDLEKAKVTMLLASTFRSIDDYSSSINYLQKAKLLAETVNDSDSLQMSIDAELAFTYFDDQEYDQSEKIMEEMQKRKYFNLNLPDKAYIIMQQGYIDFLNRNYDSAEAKYGDAVLILKKNSFCNQPVVMVKQMQLYGETKAFNKVDQTYNLILKIADSCNILKYKIYATEEIKSLYKKNDNEQKVFEYSKALDSLENVADREKNLSDMHVVNQEFLEKENESEKNHSIYTLLFAAILATALSIVGIYYFKRNKKHRNEMLKYEAEIKEIKKELKIYAELQFAETQKENDILNSEKLNKRQKELLHLVAKGFSNREIAEQLSITEATVKYHLGNIYGILDIKNRKQIISKVF